jgi:hypothetical protein
MAESVIFNGGMPYGPDVNRLKETFPVTKLTEGTIIRHEELEAVVRQQRGSQRYYGVINSWMSQQKNANGIFMVWEPATGIKVLNPAEILSHAETKTRQKIKQTGKAIRTFGWVDRNRLDETGQKRLDHQMRVANAIKQSIESARRELSVDIAPVKSLPKPQLVKSA